MTDEGSSLEFSDSLCSAIRLQRHYGARIIIATQEPTISTKLLDLCSMTIVHRFTSPAWLQTLEKHIAALSSTEDQDSRGNKKKIFDMIVELDAGQALLFSPLALLGTTDPTSMTLGGPYKPPKLGRRYMKIRVRKRLTADGGMSTMVVRGTT